MLTLPEAPEPIPRRPGVGREEIFPETGIFFKPGPVPLRMKHTPSCPEDEEWGDHAIAGTVGRAFG